MPSRILLAALVIAALPSLAADKKSSKKGKASTPAAEPAPAPAPPTPVVKTQKAASLPAGTPTKDVLAKARQLYEALEYDEVVPLVEMALADKTITDEQKLLAYELQGSSLAIVGDPVDAEKPFRLLLRAKPGFDLPEATPPKILAVFRKVQVEEKAIQEEFDKIQRTRLAATVKLIGEPPTTARGGRAVPFAYRLRDPQGAVETVRVHYRRKGDPEFISLPLKRDEEGTWKGGIPGEWTANDGGFELQFFIVAVDGKGRLASVGDDQAPSVLAVAAGQVDKTTHPVPLWGFVTAAGVTGASALIAGSLAGATAYLNYDYHAKIAAATTEEPADGGELARQADLGNSVMTAQFVGWGATALAAVVTGVLVPFTNWTGEEAEEADAAAAPAPPVTAAAGR